MKKILYIAPFVKQRFKGGIMKIAEYLSNKEAKLLLSQMNIEYDFFNSHVLSQSKNSDGKFTFENIKQAVYFLLNLIRRIKKNDFEILHINSSRGLPLLKDQLIVFLASFFTTKNIYFQIHFSGVDETFLKNIFLRRLQFFFLKKVFCVILLSENFRQQLISVGFSSTKLIVLHNFHVINNSFFFPFKKVNETLELIFIGSICERKGVVELLKALKGINIQYNMNVLGEFAPKEFESYCNSEVKLHNLNVKFCGYLDGQDKDEFLINADVLILPSYSEGFPMVIPEAMAYGCAIISTKIAGIPEIVEENFNGFLLEPGQSLELREKLFFLNKHKDILQQFKKNSYDLSSNFSLENYIKKLSLLYNS